MNCRRVINLLSAYVDGELTGVEMLEIRRHLSGCPDCAQEHKAILFTKQAMSRLGNVTPRKEFVVALMANLDEVQVSPFQKVVNTTMRYVHRRISPVAAALAASGFAMVVLSAGGMMEGMNSPANLTSASMPFEGQTVSASFLPEVHSTPASIASGRPLAVANDSSYLTTARIEFVSYSGNR